MFSGMDLLDIALLIATAIKWLVYTALLWFMIKIQKLNYNVFGLLGSSLAAVLLTTSLSWGAICRMSSWSSASGNARGPISSPMWCIPLRLPARSCSALTCGSSAC